MLTWHILQGNLTGDFSPPIYPVSLCNSINLVNRRSLLKNLTLSTKMPRLFKRSQRYNVARNCFVAKVILLDNTTIEFNLLPEVTGADCLEKVAQVMEIKEISFFGLQYQTKLETWKWVDKDKPLRKQLEKYGLEGARNAQLRFRVQYYVTNVTKLQFEITKYLYFLQLKHLILGGHLQCSNDLSVKLASYALQAEFGDYDDQKHTDEFLSDYIFLPPHIGPPSVLQSLIERSSKLHQRHRGMSPAAAELMYIKLAQQLPEYGHEIYQALNIQGSSIWLGACFIGVFVKHSNGQPNIYFKWPDIFRMKVRDKNFGIETPRETVFFKMTDHHTAQYVLRMMINQHKFYQSEVETMPGFSWQATGEGSKKKSRSLHDLRSKIMGGADRHGASSVSDKVSKSAKASAPIHRPLFVNRESSAEPKSSASPAQLSTVKSDMPASGVHVLSISGEGTTFKQELSDQESDSGPVVSTTDFNGTTEATVKHLSDDNLTRVTDSTSLTPQSTPKRQSKKPQLTLPTGNVMPPNMYPDEPQVSDATDGIRDTITDVSVTPKGSPQIKNKEGLPNGDAGDTDSSQETFELFGSIRKKMSGSLEQLTTRTPPKTLKIRTFSIEEQEEQEAASGTHDKRGAQLEKRLESGKFYSEYEQIPKKLEGDTSAGQLPENIGKNRYRDVLPYDDTRVRLNSANNTTGNEYINASHVNFTVYGRRYEYIVAQGPLEHTCTDFWQMVWEQKVHFIVMVTNEVEDCRVKCHKYFPLDNKEDGKPDYVQFEQYRVARLFVEKTPTVISRGFQLQHIPSGQEREITHLQYIDWPDYGIPENPQPFLNFLADVRSLRERYDPSVPTLVHCSAGVGRSGVVVLMDMLMAKVDCGDVLDISECLKELRQQRMHLVQMVGQYKFVYSVIIQYIGRARLI